jgi:hypothetical protein
LEYYTFDDEKGSSEHVVSAMEQRSPQASGSEDLMSAVFDLSRTRSLESVEARLNFLKPMTEKPVSYAVDPPPGVPRYNGVVDERNVPIFDARQLSQDASLDREGFALVRHRSSVRDFYDEEEVRRVYYPEAQRLLVNITGAERAAIFDHTVRKRQTPGALGSGRQSGSPLREPAGRVHVDQTTKSGPDRLRFEYGADAQDLLAGRFAIVNVWRPIRGPLLDAPLALADARSVADENLVASDLVFKDRVGETYAVSYGPRQRWFYYPRMTKDEALLIKCYDSATDVARFTPHGAFDDPTTPRDAPPRESIELRAFVFFAK